MRKPYLVVVVVVVVDLTKLVIALLVLKNLLLERLFERPQKEKNLKKKLEHAAPAYICLPLSAPCWQQSITKALTIVGKILPTTT
jgi:hypothetical protein